jgi:hypothetical protein
VSSLAKNAYARPLVTGGAAETSRVASYSSPVLMTRHLPLPASRACEVLPGSL